MVCCLVAKSHYPARLRVLVFVPLKAGLLEDPVFCGPTFFGAGQCGSWWANSRGNFVVKAELRMKMLFLHVDFFLLLT